MDLSQVELPTDCVEAYAMSCTVNGHNKDWIGCLTSVDTVITWWGAKGNRYQKATRPCPITPSKAFATLIKDKISKGYVVVDQWESRMKCWNSQSSTAAAIANKTPYPKPIFKQDLFKISKAPDTAVDYDF